MQRSIKREQARKNIEESLHMRELKDIEAVKKFLLSEFAMNKSKMDPADLEGMPNLALLNIDGELVKKPGASNLRVMHMWDRQIIFWAPKSNQIEE